MSKNIRFLLFLCTAAMAGVLGVQFFWIKNYYTLTRVNFERDANLAFEDAIKKEFSLRNDTIQGLLMQQLMDTSNFVVTAKFDIKHNRYKFYVTEKKNNRDFAQFSNINLTRGLDVGDTAYKRTILKNFVDNLRSEDLQNHVVYYRTQNLGGFELEKVRQYGFDTARLRSVLVHFLSARGIGVPFEFYLRESDSTFNSSLFPKPLLDSFPVITKSYPTYKWWQKKELFVRAMFRDPFGYIVGRMGWLFASTLALVGLVVCCMYLLLRALYREKRLSAIKNDFIDNITHEFKTPIATVSAAIEALSDFGVLGDSEKTSRYLRHSKNELERLDMLVNRVLNLSIYERGGLVVLPEDIHVGDTVREIMDSFSISAGKPIIFSFDDRCGQKVLKSDRAYFYQAIYNIFDNAVKYSLDSVHIEVSTHMEASRFRIDIKDNGIGISTQEVRLVFDRFYRAPTKAHNVKGHGLGLNYVRGIMESLGGSVGIESTKGKGTTVKLAWPI